MSYIKIDKPPEVDIFSNIIYNDIQNKNTYNDKIVAFSCNKRF